MRRAAILLVLAALGVPGAAIADWLVLKDGHRVETRGAYAVKGKTVVFTSAAGVLSSLRLDAVDLEASRAATEPPTANATANATAAPAPPRKPGRRLIFQDGTAVQQPPVGDAARPTEGREETKVAAGDPLRDDSAAPGAGSAENEALAKSSPPLVLTWERFPGEAGTAIIGTVFNRGQAMAVGIEVRVVLLDSEGTPIESKAANLTTTALAPGKTSSFRVDFPEISSFSSVRCDLTSTNLQVSNLR